MFNNKMGKQDCFTYSSSSSVPFSSLVDKQIASQRVRVNKEVVMVISYCNSETAVFTRDRDFVVEDWYMLLSMYRWACICLGIDECKPDSRCHPLNRAVNP